MPGQLEGLEEEMSVLGLVQLPGTKVTSASGHSP